MTQQEISKEIDGLIAKRYNNYSGRVMKNIQKVHNIVREDKGDEWFLNFLRQQEKDLPRPVFVITKHDE